MKAIVLRTIATVLCLLAVSHGRAQDVETPIDPNESEGPFASSLRDATNPYDAPVAGFVGPHGEGKARIQSGVDGDGNPIWVNTDNYVNPIFAGWATSVHSYLPAPGVASSWRDSSKALGPVSGDNFHVTTLGELYSTSHAPAPGALPPYVPVGDPARIPYSGNPSDPNDGFGFIGYDAPGSITLGFDTAITNGTGADFAVFENAFTSNYNTSGGGIAGQVFAELAYVEVSTDGIHFARFLNVSLTDSAVGMYGNVDPSNIFNLAGKSANAYGESWGTPFDLDTLIDATAILSALAAAEVSLTSDNLAHLQLAIEANQLLIDQGFLNLAEVNYVRLVDIPGNGTYLDSLGNPIYDAWYTFGSGGFDLDAVGAINVVPEPSTVGVLILGSLGLLFHRRHRLSRS